LILLAFAPAKKGIEYNTNVSPKLFYQSYTLGLIDSTKQSKQNYFP
jgi:hypothetical protein